MLQEFEFNTKVMGCTLDISLIAESVSEASVQEKFQEMLQCARQYEQRFSRFRPESELSSVNGGGGTCTSVSEMFTEVFLVTQDIYSATDGLFNPLLQASTLGYDRDFALLQDGVVDMVVQNSYLSAYNTDFKAITCCKSGDSYSLCMKNNQKLDFGGFLKGYVAQKMAGLCDEYNGVIVNLGGDIYTKGTDISGVVFEFSVYNPITNVDDMLIPLYDGAMATSGNYKRTWKRGEKVYSHIVSAETKENPKTNLVSATVLHQDGAIADAYATVAMTLSGDESQAFLKAQECRYVLITDNGTHMSNI